VTFFKGAQVKDPKRLVLSVGARLRRRAESAALAAEVASRVGSSLQAAGYPAARQQRS